MKIVYIVNARIPTEKAHGYQICKMCEEFGKLGHDVELWVSERENEIKEEVFSFYGIEENFKINELKSIDLLKYQKYIGRAAYYIMLIVFVIKLLFKKVNKNTLIYTRNPEIGWLFKKKGYRVIFEAHSLPKKKRLYKLLTKSIDYIVCNSKGTSEALIKCGLKNTIIAPNGVDLKDFNIVEDNEVLRRSLGLPADKKIIMYVGHLYKWKGVDVIIEAADDLRNNKDILFVLIGGQEKKINEYKEIVNTRKLKNILFLGYKKKNEISKFLKSSDILLLPNVPISIESLEYTSPIKMFEYMASLKPIIASDLPSIREVLNEETAKFIKAGSAVEMSNAIRIILENRELADNLAQSAHSKVKNFTWTKRAEFILNHVCQFNKSNTY